MADSQYSTPYLSVCLSIRNSNPRLLEQCLQSVRSRAPKAEIVIVDNMSHNEDTIAVAKKYADVFAEYRGPNGDWTKDDPWTYDMGSSRQHAFEIAHGVWRMWIDDDDRLPGPEEATTLLKQNGIFQPAPSGAKIHAAAADPVTLEDLLRQVEEKLPDADCIWAPYLYAKDASGSALVFQHRERIVKWSSPPKWRWAEAAHEILVPVEGYSPKHRVEFASLLFVHEREFNEAGYNFAIRRHFDVLYRQYENNDRTTRRCLYLAAYAPQLSPDREEEFIQAAHEAATTPLDRYRCMMAFGAMKIRSGLFMDALEAFGAATHLRKDLPDAWIQGAEAWSRAEDWGRAAEWFEKGLACSVGDPDSQIAPRHQYVRYPVLLSEIYARIAKFHLKAGNNAEAQAYYRRAVELLEKVRSHPAIGPDIMEADARLKRMANDAKAHASAISIDALARYLMDNDEPQKALAVIQNAPWNVQDHPLVVNLEKTLQPVSLHIHDKKAYQKFYETDLETGYVPSPESWLHIDAGLSRVKWAADWINKHKPRAQVLEIGCFDGIIGIPLLRACPGITYIGVDPYEKSIQAFRERAVKYDVADRCMLHRVDAFGDLPSYMFDVILWFEVIEHVPYPASEMSRLAYSHLRADGHFFVSTPWGSFDAGHPPAKNAHGGARDPRGHLRAMTPRDVVNTFHMAGLDVKDLSKVNSPVETVGDALHARGVWTSKMKSRTTTMNVVVPGALWDWHGRMIHNAGMGASEKSIVHFGEALSEERYVNVYGPVPEPDVCNGVRYWPKEHTRHIKDGKIVVSRSPGYALHMKQSGVLEYDLPKILWLQDAYYPDLNAEVAKEYETIVVVSQWHKKAMHELHGVPLEKMEVIYNPIDPRLYKDVDRNPRKFIYASSPDRALIPLLKMWARIRSRLPDATLEIFYGWRGCEKLGMGGDPHWMKRYMTTRREFEKLRHQPGITVRDMVSPSELANAYCSAGAWLYPCTTFNETCCTNALEARAAGCVPVSTGMAALDETARTEEFPLMSMPDTTWEDHPYWIENYVDLVVASTKVSAADRDHMAARAMERYSISAQAELWRDVLEGKKS